MGHSQRREQREDRSSAPARDVNYDEGGVVGRVKKIIADRGFGFIELDDGSEFFFHHSAAAEFELLQRGTLVRFVPTKGKKGPRAENVARVQ